jgi:hypothetical protein
MCEAASKYGTCGFKLLNVVNSKHISNRYTVILWIYARKNSEIFRIL